MVVSDSLTYGDVFGALEPLSRTLGRQVNPTVCSTGEFSKRGKDENAFLARVLEGSKVWVLDWRMTFPPPPERLARPGSVLGKALPIGRRVPGLRVGGTDGGRVTRRVRQAR